MVKLNMHKALFILSGLALVVFFTIVGRSHYVEAAPQEGQKFDDWIVACAKDDKKQTCFLSQVLSSKDDPKQRIAEFRIGYFGDKALKMVQILPFGVNLQSGTSIISNEKLTAPGKFTTCQQFGCIAVTDLSKESVDLILSSETNYVGMISSEGKQMNIIMSNKGLKAGLEVLK